MVPLHDVNAQVEAIIVILGVSTNCCRLVVMLAKIHHALVLFFGCFVVCNLLRIEVVESMKATQLTLRRKNLLSCFTSDASHFRPWVGAGVLNVKLISREVVV
jgi:hypothetical protein